MSFLCLSISLYIFWSTQKDIDVIGGGSKMYRASIARCGASCPPRGQYSKKMWHFTPQSEGVVSSVSLSFARENMFWSPCVVFNRIGNAMLIPIVLFCICCLFCLHFQHYLCIIEHFYYFWCFAISCVSLHLSFLCPCRLPCVCSLSLDCFF